MTELKAKREFAGGAWRDTEDGKLDYEAFLSPAVLQAYAKYLHKHRTMPDGSLRDGDNWQNGIPQDVYVKSLMRHVVDVWLHHRGQSELATEPLPDALGGVIFNAMGYWFEELGDRKVVDFDGIFTGPINQDPTSWWKNAPYAAAVEPADAGVAASIKVGDYVRPYWQPHAEAGCVVSFSADGQMAHSQLVSGGVVHLPLSDLVKSNG